jgi:putative transposase
MEISEARRSVVGCLMEERSFSQRRACRLVGLARSVAQCRLRARGDEMLRRQLKDLAARFRRHGYVRLHVLLAGDGLVVNRKRTCRLPADTGGFA